MSWIITFFANEISISGNSSPVVRIDTVPSLRHEATLYRWSSSDRVAGEVPLLDSRQFSQQCMDVHGDFSRC